jgi:polyvinyl alcohol dehydrogenase (cytochrome)
MWRRTLGTATVCAAVLTAPLAAGGATTGTDWSAYGRNPGHSSASFGDAAVTTTNAGQLTAAWQFAPGTRLDASPTVVGGRVYIGGRNAMFYVLDAATGALIWKKQLDQGSSSFCPAKGIVGTTTVKTDPVDGSLTVYTPGAHYLYALNAASGTQKWRTAIGPATTAGAGLYFNWASPTLAGGRIFMGMAANCEARLIRGGVVSLDQHTGKRLHTYYAVPQGKVGASVWSSEASDGKTVWATTGNPDPNGTTIDDAYSIVRLSASTLTKLDKWTLPLGQTQDLDFGSSPTLFNGVIGGVSTSLVGACNKNGVFYAWRAANLAAGPVWSDQVAGSEFSGQGFCITSAAWDYKAKKLWVATQTKSLNGVTVGGAVREINPNNGVYLWQVGLPCGVTGSPVINAQTRVLAVGLANCPGGTPSAVRFFNADTGTLLGSVPAAGDVFAQPVFAEGHVYVADESGRLTAYAP